MFHGLSRSLLALSLFAGTLTLAFAAGKKLEGVVTVVDADKGTITIVTGEDGGKFYDLKLAKDVKVIIDEHVGRPQELKDCAFCKCELGDDDKTVVKIDSFFGKEEDPLGFIKKVSADEITIERDNADRTFKVSDKVRVYINAQPAKIADLKDAKPAFLRLRGDAVVIIWCTMRSK